ncbi:MAG: glycosyltransferase family 1 protein [Spirochaetaceae bacterium]|nr:MAG: glycosyltransferase family 1 protein [Spirochaetaceae bacterium]
MKYKEYTVSPRIPRALKPLEELAHDLWVSWNHDAQNLFTRLSYDAWMTSKQNPVLMLGMVPEERYRELAEDDSYQSALKRVVDRFRQYKSGKDTWYKGSRKNTIAYFSMEYGLDVCLPIYSGGLGVLSGDHMKSASDLGLPLVGVGLLYQQGYFRQYLNADGFQQESYPENDWYNMPVWQVLDQEGREVRISVQLPGSSVVARVWEVQIGRISLYLLDANVEENSPENRSITSSLYGGDREMRIKQEILLGIGGIRALRAMGINPAVTHMNEGHSAFLGIERIREYVQNHGLTRHEAMQALWPTSIFTTHTPVPAGNERFGIDMMQKYFHVITDGTGFTWEEFIALGRENPMDHQEPFCMTVLAIHLSAHNNGVSRLHGAVSREMWRQIWSGLPDGEIPIGHITNGVHSRSFLSPEMKDLLDRYFGPRFEGDPTFTEVWERMNRISDEELWRVHEIRKNKLVAFARKRLKQQLVRRGASHTQQAYAEEVLSPYTLTISFARRFATYKRATLLFRDPERLKKLLTNQDRPVQIIFAGKAHPHDIPGKNLIKDIIHYASDPEIRSKIVFIENYDLEVAKHLVSGSDIWLNTPRRPLEASGTSGMKAAINGVQNCSVLDGWWAEGYDTEVGYAIGAGEEYADEDLQDEIESKLLYDLLEREIIPSYYDRSRDGLPREWIGRMKNSMRKLGGVFSTSRMLMEYSTQFYLPALKYYDQLRRNDHEQARNMAGYLHRLRSQWKHVAISEISGGDEHNLKVGSTFSVTCSVHLGSLVPEDVTVQVYTGRMNADGTLVDTESVPMKAVSSEGGISTYRTRVRCRHAGRQGYAIRVLPSHPDLVHPWVPGLLRWSS